MKRRKWVAALAVLLSATFAMVVPTTAQAATKGCEPKIGKRTPVILVHGFNSSADTAWGKAMEPYIKEHASGVDVLPFDYKDNSLRWVDNDNIGPRLAERIACVAASSKAAGGPGKVVAIGHSMGGLAIRYAATKASNHKEVAGDLGLVITIATPNLGSGWANIGAGIKQRICPHAGNFDACSAFNAVDGLANYGQKIGSLPFLSGNTPLKAFAGDVTINVGLFRGVVKWDTGSDLVVAKGSALDRSAQSDWGGGKQTIRCTQAPAPLGNCWHSALTSNDTVMKAVVGSIGQYQFAFKLQPYLGDWGAHGTGMHIDGDGTGTFSFRDYNNCPDPTETDFFMCNVHAKIKAKPTDTGMTVTVTSSYTEIKGNTSTARTVTVKSGTAYKFQKPDAKNGIVHFDFGGVPYQLCRQGGIADNAGKCGI